MAVTLTSALDCSRAVGEASALMVDNFALAPSLSEVWIAREGFDSCCCPGVLLFPMLLAVAAAFCCIACCLFAASCYCLILANFWALNLWYIIDDSSELDLSLS